MTEFKDILPEKLFEIISKNGITTTKQILTKSVCDIKKSTNLNTDDILLLKHIASGFIFASGVIRGDQLSKKVSSRVTTGCLELDNFLRGGLRRGTITEVYGESGCGKTQLCLHATTHNWKSGVVYVCTEGLFPIKRVEQMKQALPGYDPSVDYCRKIFIEHIIESNNLLSYIRICLPKLLDAHRPSLIIIDSIAAPFRSETTNYIQRAQDLKEVGVLLVLIAKKYDLAVICINQVQSSFETNDNHVLPCLGLAWSNMISSRIFITKTNKSIKLCEKGSRITEDVAMGYTHIRQITIIFSPELPPKKFQFIVTSTGINYFPHEM